jgi:hypothetical protein
VLPDAVRNATSLPGVIQLVDVLGIPSVARRIPRTAIRHIDGAVYHLGDRGSLQVICVELERDVTPAAVFRTCVTLREFEPVRPFLAILAAPAYQNLTLACFAPDGDVRHLTFEPHAPVASDIDVMREMIASPDDLGVSLALRYAAALDVRAVTARFFTEVRAQRDQVAAGLRGIPSTLSSEREQLALLLICRLLFLYFLQKQGHLAGDASFVRGRIREHVNLAADGSVYRAILLPLFFDVLNTRPENRTAAARLIGPLPYLNGGLFERTTLERRFPDIDLSDPICIGIFNNLLDRFRFTATEASEVPAGLAGIHIDPEMLGRIFEGLMETGKRADTGTFYTPPAVVDALTTRAVAEHVAQKADVGPDQVHQLLSSGDVGTLTYPERKRVTRALREVRVLDPACGSGAFLLGALSRVSAARAALGEMSVDARRDIVARSLHGVDLLDDAALLCSLRLWLALADTGSAVPAPLPNLDRRIRQGDALLDPIELLAPGVTMDVGGRAIRDRVVRRALAELEPLARAYIDAEPDARLALRTSIAASERRLAVAWIDAFADRLDAALREKKAASLNRDLWGSADDRARLAERAIGQLARRQGEVRALRTRVDDAAVLPFFSFQIHFAENPRFDVILSNPPWIRAHRWPPLFGKAVRERYEVCRQGGWPAAAQYGSRSGGQVDLAVLFLERTLSLLAPGGTTGLVLPAKILRSLYAGGARALTLRTAHICSIDDYSLDQRAVFKADAFTVALVARRKDESADGRASSRVRVRLVSRTREPLEFHLNPDQLPVVQDDPAAPWLLAPPDVHAVFRRMQQRGNPIAGQEGLSIGRGVVTGANDVLVIRDFAHKLGGLSQIRAEGFYHARKLAQSSATSRKFAAYIETEALRPLLRGCDVKAWCGEAASRVIWVNAAGRRRTPQPRLERYLARHAAALEARTGTSINAPSGSLMRVSSATLGHKVVWRDIAQTLHAAAVPDAVRGDAGKPVPVVPLNTTYFIAAPDRDTSLLLAAYMNSLPLRVFARAAAERAKDAHFRFFAWTIGILPLPANWRVTHADELRELSSNAHTAGGVSGPLQARLDALVADAFGLEDADLEALLFFDHWLSGIG